MDEKSSELHSLLETIEWSQIRELFHSDPTGVVKRHVSECTKCQERENEAIDSQLAEMQPEKRAQILEIARALAAQF